MVKFDPSALCKWSKGNWNLCPPEKISGFTIDSRKVNQGDLFVALRAERDGHNFLKQAISQGAVGGSSRALSSRVPHRQAGRVVEEPPEAADRGPGDGAGVTPQFPHRVQGGGAIRGQSRGAQPGGSARRGS